MMDDKISQLESRLRDKETDLAVLKVQITTIDNRTASIEDTLKWLVRLVIGALLMAIVGFAMSGGFNIG